MRKIKASTLVPGNSYHFALYSDREKIMPCKLVSRPETQIGLMENSDRFVIEKEDGSTLSFRRNNCEPFYLVTDIPGKREGSTVLERVVFFGEDLVPKVPGKRGRHPKVKENTEATETVTEKVDDNVLTETPVIQQAQDDVVTEASVEEQPEDDFDPKLLPAGGLRIGYYRARKAGDTHEMNRIREVAGM